jgi:hypothetical protein
MLPTQSVHLALDEMRYARGKLGMRGGFLRPNPYHGKKMISDPMYEPFWAMAEELDFSIGFQEGSTNAMPTVGVDRFEEDRTARHMVSLIRGPSRPRARGPGGALRPPRGPMLRLAGSWPAVAQTCIATRRGLEVPVSFSGQLVLRSDQGVIQSGRNAHDDFQIQNTRCRVRFAREQR